MDADHVPLFVDESFRKLNAGTIESHSNPSCLEQIQLAILYENAPAFVELINNLPSDILDEELDYILTSILLWDSGKCAAAVLDGQTKIPEISLVTSSVSQLHQAVEYSAYKITALLLQRGFSADVKGDYDRLGSGGKVKNVLPLHAAMTSLRSQLHQAVAFSAHKITALLLQRGFLADVRGGYDRLASGGKLKNVLPLHVPMNSLCFHMVHHNIEEESCAVMLVKLCQQHYRRTLETVRLIALNTKEVKREFINYLNEGKLIEVGALLLVAKSQILSPSTAKGEGEFRSISEICDFFFKTKLRIRNHEVEMRTIDLFEICDNIGDKLAALVRLDFTPTCLANCSTLLAASLIEDAGFDVNNFFYGYSYTSFCRSEAESHFLKGAMDACEKTICTSDTLPIWVKEAALTGLGVKPGSISRLTYPFLAETLPYVNSVSVTSPMLENMPLLHHLLKRAAPFLEMIKRVFRHG